MWENNDGKDLQYSSRPTRKSFYFQTKVSVWRGVLHGQAPYQHCDSSMQRNFKDQRFQRILMSAYRHHLKSSPHFRQRKLKFSECILKLWIPVTFTGSLSHSWQARVLHEPLCYACWDYAESDQVAGFIWKVEFFSVGSGVQSCSCPADISQGWHRIEKNRQEKQASAYIDLSTSTTYRTKVQHLISLHQIISYWPPGYSCSTTPQ